MTIHEALHTSARQPLLTVCLLLLTLQIALIISSFRNGRSGRIKILYLLQFALGFAVFYLPMLDICWEHDHSDLSVQPPAASLRGPYCGAAIMYRSLKCPKSAVWVQGSTHGYVPPMPQKIVW